TECDILIHTQVPVGISHGRCERRDASGTNGRGGGSELHTHWWARNKIDDDIGAKPLHIRRDQSRSSHSTGSQEHLRNTISIRVDSHAPSAVCSGCRGLVGLVGSEEVAAGTYNRRWGKYPSIRGEGDWQA